MPHMPVMGCRGLEGSCWVHAGVEPIKCLVEIALPNSQPAFGVHAPVLRTGGLREHCTQQDTLQGWLTCCPHSSTTATGMSWTATLEGISGSGLDSLLGEKGLLLSSLVHFDLVYFSPFPPQFCLGDAGQPVTTPCLVALSGWWSSGEHVHFVLVLGSPVGPELCRAGACLSLATCM